MYRHDLLGLFHPQGKEKHQLKGCLCRYLRRNNCLHPTLLLKLTSRLQLLKVQMKYFPVQVEPTKQMSPISVLRVTWKWTRLLEAEKEFSSLQKKNDELDRKITENEQHQETMSVPVYFLSIVSSLMQMLTFILAFPIMPLS